MRRWDLYRAQLRTSESSVQIQSPQTRSRPVLIISIDEFNERMDGLTVVPLVARKPFRTVYANEVLIPAGRAGLTEESIVLAHQIWTLSKRLLTDHIGTLEDAHLRESVLTALRNQLGMF